METEKPFRLYSGIIMLYKQLGAKKKSPAPRKVYSISE